MPRAGTISRRCCRPCWFSPSRSEEHTSELQSQSNLVCRLLLEKKKHPTPNALPPNVTALPQAGAPEGPAVPERASLDPLADVATPGVSQPHPSQGARVVLSADL